MAREMLESKHLGMLCTPNVLCNVLIENTG